MAKKSGKYLKRIRRRNAIKIAVVVVIFLAGVIAVFLNREKTMLLEPETFIISAETEALFIKNEAVIYFGHDIVQLQKEGIKVSKNTVLAKELDTTSYAEYEKEIIKIKLDNYMYEDNTAFFDDIKKTVGKEEDESSLATVKYLFYSEKQLNSLYDKYDKMEKNDELKLIDTPIDFAGQVYYSTDGYEYIAPISVLSVLSPEYLDYVNGLNKNKLIKRDAMVVKVIDNSCIFVSFVLPVDTKVDYENTVIEYKSNVLDKYALKYSGYFLFLKERVDVLRQYPKIYFEIDGKTICGQFIDVKEFEDNKIITLCVNKAIEDIINIRTADVAVHTQRYANVFKIPISCVYENNNGLHCIDIIDKGKIRKTYAVTIRGYDDTGDYVLIDTKGIMLSSKDDDTQDKSSESMVDYSILIK